MDMMKKNNQSERYLRQYPVIGEEGQEKLQNALVVIAGAGGLGSVIALYCAAAGIGRIRIIDGDVVDMSNLNRQILYRTDDIGSVKVRVAESALSSLNPSTHIEPVHSMITESSVQALIEEADLVIDGLDNFSSRYILAHAAWEDNIPFIHGAVNGFYGQATTIIPGVTPCLKCLIPAAPSSYSAPSPILGVTAGAIGIIQANEAIKILTGMGDLLTGRMLLWDGLRGDVSILPIENNPDCHACGE